MSAVWCVIPAVEAAVAAGIVDKDRIGLTGHSMGGWETAHLITQTDAFKAAVAGAPLTDLISMYGSIYGVTGTANAPIFESSQARMSRNYIENLEAFIRNSPVFHADKVKTPLLIMHNDNDGSVDWNQGVEYYNLLRRLEKPVVMLQYKGEGHSLQKFPNRLDYSLRVKEFFDHYLLGKAAPRWLEKGVSRLEMKDYLREQMKKYRDLLDKGISR
jgi:dipeptidyl aminopeptidase/acylaminoacyl peptidase